LVPCETLQAFETLQALSGLLLVGYLLLGLDEPYASVDELRAHGTAIRDERPVLDSLGQLHKLRVQLLGHAARLAPPALGGYPAALRRILGRMRPAKFGLLPGYWQRAGATILGSGLANRAQLPYLPPRSALRAGEES
jgi:hypothetical protein